MRYAVLITVLLGLTGLPAAHGSAALKAPHKHTPAEKKMSQQFDQAMQQLAVFKKTHDVTPLSTAISLADAMPGIVLPAPPAGLPPAKDKLALWFAIFDAMDAEIAPDFNPDDLPELTVAPPLETGLPAGVAPSAIKDPAVRKKYEDALAANDLKNQRFSYQYALLQENQRAESDVEKFITVDVARDPAQLEFLRSRLALAKLQPQRIAKLQALLEHAAK
ncbi:hypothetical protein GTP91_10440 [Rugamonas sp. FT82W]|uniref:DUF3106 domain-containing protein n=1 Tax=Duganella vulcania TaxID=2692166 RepID=A0A845G3M1_9BURK|nr:hypothetical protein [Duganella vulcania]MYM87597.1 hypothetical protein [Duganella vulcania]